MDLEHPRGLMNHKQQRPGPAPPSQAWLCSACHTRRNHSSTNPPQSGRESCGQNTRFLLLQKLFFCTRKPKIQRWGSFFCATACTPPGWPGSPPSHPQAGAGRHQRRAQHAAAAAAVRLPARAPVALPQHRQMMIRTKVPRLALCGFEPFLIWIWRLSLQGIS